MRQRLRSLFLEMYNLPAAVYSRKLLLRLNFMDQTLLTYPRLITFHFNCNEFGYRQVKKKSKDSKNIHALNLLYDSIGIKMHIARNTT